MVDSWLVILPPLVVLLAALLSRHVIGSLLIGIITSCLILTKGSILQAGVLAGHRIIVELLDTDHLFTFGFLITLGILIEFLTHSGGIYAYSQRIKKYISNTKSVETLSLLISCSFFLDDYLNSLTTGAIMRPLTDSMRIPRAKLAFMLDSMSAPLCVLVPATSWIAMILIQLQVSGISIHQKSLVLADPFSLYIQCIPFLFYPLCIVISAFFIVRAGISYGAMNRYEHIAQTSGNVFGGKQPLSKSHLPESLQVDDKTHGSIYNFIAPLIAFLAVLLIGLLWTGNYHSFGGQHSFSTALLSSNIFLSLCMASSIALLFSIIFYATQRILNLKNSLLAVYNGFMLMKNSFIVLLLAWTLSSLLKNDLHTGQYLAHLMIGTVSVMFMPVLFFITSVLISASTGSAWGTIAVMIPLCVPLITSLYSDVTPLLLSTVPLLLPTLAGLVSGAVAGGHFSAITDSSVMAATSAGCYHLDHVQTQISYSWPALIASSLGYCLVGILMFNNVNYFVTSIVGVGSSLACTILLIFLRSLYKK